jgi:hypothetical protein
MSALLPVSKIPAAVILDVLPLIRRSGRAKAAAANAALTIPDSVIARFISECMHQSANGGSASLTAIAKRLKAWGTATGRWTSTIPSPRQLAGMLRDQGIATGRGHNNVTTARGWQLN